VRFTGWVWTRDVCIEKVENGAIPLETTGLVEKPKDKLHVKSEQDAFSMSGAGSSSHNSQSTNSRTSQRAYDKLAFPRQELQSLGMLGLSFFCFLIITPDRIWRSEPINCANWVGDTDNVHCVIWLRYLMHYYLILDESRWCFITDSSSSKAAWFDCVPNNTPD